MKIFDNKPEILAACNPKFRRHTTPKFGLKNSKFRLAKPLHWEKSADTKGSATLPLSKKVSSFCKSLLLSKNVSSFCKSLLQETQILQKSEGSAKKISWRISRNMRKNKALKSNILIFKPISILSLRMLCRKKRKMGQEKTRNHRKTAFCSEKKI